MVIPTVTSISPTSGPQAGGTTVIIIGTGFGAATAVDFGGVAAVFTIDSDTQIMATSPAGAGTVDVTVTTDAGTSATSSADQFSYASGPLSLVVTTLADRLDANFDPADLTLRDALAIANSNPGTDTISFDPSLDGGTITLSLGELAIADSVTIEGPGATNLTINANNQSRIFDINDGNGATNIDVEIDGLTLTGGDAPIGDEQGAGGAIFSLESLTLMNSTITGNTATTRGGGIYSWGYSGNVTTIQNCTVANNTAQYGGGIWASSGYAATLTIQDSTVSGNAATGSSGNGGGGIYIYDNSGTTLIQQTTISGNVAESQSGGTVTRTSGGGILVWRNWGTITIDSDTISGNVGGAGGGIMVRNSYNGQTVIENSTISGNTGDQGGGAFLRTSSGAVAFQNSTVSGNTAAGNGGGLYLQDYQSIAIQNSTITGNTAQGTGGGIFVNPPTALYYDPGTVDVRSTIIAGNTDASATAPDVFSTYTDPNTNTVYSTADFDHCLVGNNADTGLAAAPIGSPDANGNLIGTPIAPIDPKLGPLAYNGGPTETCALLAGSPAIDMGSNPADLLYDQRGPGYPRVSDGEADIGAFESTFAAAPTVTAISPATGPATGGTTVTITGMGFTGATAVDFGNTAAASFTVVSDTQITATSPLGTGTVDVTVTTPAGTSSASSTDQFTYATGPLNLVVTTLADRLDTAYDPADLSLRDALAIANANPGADTISFDSSLDGGTINLSLGQLAITDSVTIEGPGAANLTIAGNGTSQIFGVGDGNDATNIDVEIDGLTLTGGRGAIYSTENLTLDSLDITGNDVQYQNGGGIAIYTSGTTTIRNSTISDDRAGSGGAISIGGTGDLLIQDCTISDNVAHQFNAFASAGNDGGISPASTIIIGGPQYQGGGIYVGTTGTATIDDCTISGNSATSGGGGIYVAGGATTIENSTVSNNTGGGIWVATNSGYTTTIQNSTISGNSATQGGAGIDVNNPNGGSTAILGSTITGNSGGGIHVIGDYWATTTIQGCTVAANVSGTDGGGISVWNSHNATMTIQNSTITENSSGYDGGGIFAMTSYGGTVTLQNCTITGNSADYSGGISAYSGLSVASTIIAGNIAYTGAEPDVYGSISFSHCLIGDNTGSQLTEAPVVTPNANGNLIGGPIHGVIDPKLGPLADNGGPTRTCPCWPAARPSTWALTRPIWLTIARPGLPAHFRRPADIGAYEALSSAAAPTVTAISPATGPVTGGTTVTITGTGFTGATAVDFGNTAAASFTVVSDTQITATTPIGGGAVDVTVTTPAGSSTTSSADQFSYASGPLNLVVTTLADKLDANYDPNNLSLRAALAIANVNPGPDTISFFAPSLFAPRPGWRHDQPQPGRAGDHRCRDHRRPRGDEPHHQRQLPVANLRHQRRQ